MTLNSIWHLLISSTSIANLIGLAAVERLRADRSGLHSRKLRSFDEPPFR